MTSVSGRMDTAGNRGHDAVCELMRDSLRNVFDRGAHESIIIDDENGIGASAVRLAGVCYAPGIDHKDAIRCLIAFRYVCMSIDNHIRELLAALIEERGIIGADAIAVSMANVDIAMPAIPGDGNQFTGRIAIPPIAVAAHADDLVIAEPRREDVIDIVLDISCMQEHVKWELLPNGITEEFILSMGIADDDNLVHKDLL